MYIVVLEVIHEPSDAFDIAEALGQFREGLALAGLRVAIAPLATQAIANAKYN